LRTVFLRRCALAGGERLSDAHQGSAARSVIKNEFDRGIGISHDAPIVTDPKENP
jgi:hypothetical protein